MSMKRDSSLLVALAAVTVAGLLSAAPAGATRPEAVELETHGSFITRTGTWAASGAFTDAGTYVETPPKFGGPVGRGYLTLTGERGTITFHWVAKITFQSATARALEGHWRILSGTGVYRSLHGGGALEIVATIPTRAVDVVMVGTAHFDPT
jgi:hypothetical protein